MASSGPDCRTRSKAVAVPRNCSTTAWPCGGLSAASSPSDDRHVTLRRSSLTLLVAPAWASIRVPARRTRAQRHREPALGPARSSVRRPTPRRSSSTSAGREQAEDETRTMALDSNLPRGGAGGAHARAAAHDRDRDRPDADRRRGSWPRVRRAARRLARPVARAELVAQPRTVRVPADRPPAGFGGQHGRRAGDPHADLARQGGDGQGRPASACGRCWSGRSRWT